jgi:type I restriction enzyme S subunit
VIKAVRHAELGDVAEFVRGVTFKPNDVIPVGAEKAVACMRTKNVQLDLDTSDVWGLPASFVKRDTQLLRRGDILVSSANSWNLVGKCCWVPSLPWPATLGGFISALRPKNGEIEPRYLYWWFASDPIQAEVRSCARQTTNIANLSLEQCLTINLPIPPLDEQRRIAAMLDQCDDLRRKRREAAQRLNSLGAAIFLETFGNPRLNPFGFKPVKLGDIINFVGGSQPPKSTFLYEDGPNRIRFVQIRDFSSDEYKTYIPVSLAKRPFETDDVMIGRYGPPVFQIFRGLSGSYNVALMKAEPRPGILKDFVYYLLQEKELHGFVVANSERTAGQSGVNLALLDAYPAYVPPVELQQTFAAQIATIGNLQTSHFTHLAKLDALFASLQHRAFRGEL